MKRFLILFFAIFLAACATDTFWTEGDRMTPDFDGEEERPAGIRGTIRSIENGVLRVEAEPNTPSEHARALVTSDAETQVAHLDGRPATFADLRTGSFVSIWFTEEVAESDPIQAKARRIVIER